MTTPLPHTSPSTPSGSVPALHLGPFPTPAINLALGVIGLVAGLGGLAVFVLLSALDVAPWIVTVLLAPMWLLIALLGLVLLLVIRRFTLHADERGVTVAAGGAPIHVPWQDVVEIRERTGWWWGNHPEIVRRSGPPLAAHRGGGKYLPPSMALRGITATVALQQIHRQHLASRR